MLVEGQPWPWRQKGERAKNRTDILQELCPTCLAPLHIHAVFICLIFRHHRADSSAPTPHVPQLVACSLGHQKLLAQSLWPQHRIKGVRDMEGSQLSASAALT